MLEAADHSKWCVLFSFMLGTGLRPSEALGLQWPDLDLARGTVSVRRTLARVNGRWLFEEPKTKSSRRTVPLPLGLTTELSEHMSRQLELGFTNSFFAIGTAARPMSEGLYTAPSSLHSLPRDFRQR